MKSVCKCLAVAAVIVLAGCGDQSEPTAPTTNAAPANASAVPVAEPTKADSAPAGKAGLIGIEMSVVPDTYIEKHKVSPMTGILVTAAKADWPAEQAGLKAGDVIYRVGDTTIDSFKVYRDALIGKESIQLKVFRDGKNLDFTVFVRPAEGPEAPPVFNEEAEKQFRKNAYEKCAFKDQLITLK